MSTVPCCSQPVQNYWRGTHCRCCGASLHRAGNFVVGCNRQHFGLASCPDCHQNTCGPHYVDREPYRRYCEICGQLCGLNNGVCPQHGRQQA